MIEDTNENKSMREELWELASQALNDLEEEINDNLSRPKNSLTETIRFCLKHLK